MQRPSITQLQIEQKLEELRVQYMPKENASRRPIILLQSRALVKAWELTTGKTYQKGLNI